MDILKYFHEHYLFNKEDAVPYKVASELYYRGIDLEAENERLKEVGKEFISDHMAGIHTGHEKHGPPIRWCDESSYQDFKDALKALGGE